MLFRSTTKIALGKAQIEDIQTKAMKARTDAANHAADRRSKLQLEAMKLQQSELVHRDKIIQTDRHKIADIMHNQDQSAEQRAYDAYSSEAQRAHDMQTGEADRMAQASLASLKTKAPDNV